MIENIETLLELYKRGTMARAGHALRVSQSAVSKRIAALELEYGVPLIERTGRNVVLNENGLELINKVGPLLQDIKEALKEKNEVQQVVKIGVSESILSSWGASELEKVFRKLQLQVEYHSHRSPLVIERVEAGIYDIGLCSGQIRNSRSVISEPLVPEELVLVTSGSSKWGLQNSDLSILTIERSSATWKSIDQEIERCGLQSVQQLESFFAIGQLAKAGHGVGLVPAGVARALGFKKNCIRSFRPKLYRPVQIVYKKSKLERSYFGGLIEALKKIKNC